MVFSEMIDEFFYFIVVLIDELRNEDVQVFYDYLNFFQIEDVFLRMWNKNIFEYLFYFKLDLKLVCLIQNRFFVFFFFNRMKYNYFIFFFMLYVFMIYFEIKFFIDCFYLY